MSRAVAPAIGQNIQPVAIFDPDYPGTIRDGIEDVVGELIIDPNLKFVTLSGRC